MKNKEPPYVYDRAKLPELLTVVEAANFVRTSEQNIRNKIREGKIKALIDDKLIRVYRKSLLEYAGLEVTS